jgi:beta-lactamase class A
MKQMIALFFLLLPLLMRAQKADKKLQREIETLVTGFNGDIGIYVHNLKHKSMRIRFFLLPVL